MRLAALHRHADLFEQFFAMLLQQIGQVRQRQTFSQRLGHRRKPTRETVEYGKSVEADRFETRLVAMIGGRSTCVALSCGLRPITEAGGERRRARR